jgi:NNP family nitrate/nitrite transporter-like MFS transporter
VSVVAPRIAFWEPEDSAFWAREGARVARRNLAVSVPVLVLSFAVWMLWSVVVVQLPRVGFRFTANQLFWLAAVPGLAGSTLRLFFSFMVPMFGGRTWTVLTTLALLVPTVGLGIAVQDPTTGYPTFLLLALTAGIGGGNFASSMANISFFYPADCRGQALGWNAGLGNLGVGLAQVAVPLVVCIALFGPLGGAPQVAADGDATRTIWLQNAGFVWVPFIVAAALFAWRRMDDLEPVRASAADQAVVFVRPHTWLLAWLYLGSFGSFIGFAAGFPLVADMQFPGAGIAGYAFVGPLLAAFARPAGGSLADRYGGARVALVAFVVLALTVLALLLGPGSGMAGGVTAFVALFAGLFVASGIANGAVFQLIPAVFVRVARRSHRADAEGEAAAVRAGTLEGAAALGLASGIGALGGFFIPKAYGTAIALTGNTAAALVLFLVFYASCIALTWWFYLRPRAEAAC